ncbi:hypothetical protein OpiT1DRAFT_02199 [Opitutaceae bacterium TAV1]|nr:hypothetical protein OpiT1DRAFT_02199 [Opitutaceae bacterium TAV1]
MDNKIATALLRFLALPAAGLLIVSASAASSALVYEELFTSSANANLFTSIGWTGYGFSTGGSPASADISNVTASNTLFVGGGTSNPSTDANGYLAAILGNTDASNPNRYGSYITYETGLALNLTDATATWRMNGGAGNTVRVRLLVQTGGEWYASAISDTAQKYFVPTAYGTGADFTSGGDTLAKSLALTTASTAWEKLTFDTTTHSVTFTTLTQNLALTNITGIGFHILGGGTGRIDTLQVTVPIPEPQTLALLVGLATLALAALHHHRHRAR